LLAAGDVGLNDCALVQSQIFRKRGKTVEASGTQHHLGAGGCQMTSRRFTQPTTGTRDDDDFAFNILRQADFLSFSTADKIA
jgi:hypothetical protein